MKNVWRLVVCCCVPLPTGYIRGRYHIKERNSIRRMYQSAMLVAMKILVQTPSYTIWVLLDVLTHGKKKKNRSSNRRTQNRSVWTHTYKSLCCCSTYVYIKKHKIYRKKPESLYPSFLGCCWGRAGPLPSKYSQNVELLLNKRYRPIHRVPYVFIVGCWWTCILTRLV